MEKMERKPYIAIVLIALLTISTTAMMTNNASATDIRQYCPNLTPTTANCGDTVGFTLTIDPGNSNTETIGSVKMEWPSDWTDPTSLVVTPPGTKAWTISFDGDTDSIKLSANSDADELSKTEASLTQTFSSTAPSTLSGCGGYYGCYTWSEDGSGATFMLRAYT